MSQRAASCRRRADFAAVAVTKLVSSQGSAMTKEEAEKAFQDTSKLDNEVNDLMSQLTAAEQELKQKKAQADQDMMMAGMVRLAEHSDCFSF